MGNHQLDYATKHILVVDDKEFLRTVLSDIFRAVGFHVHNYSDVDAALTFLTSHNFNVDLMIIDHHVPFLPCSRIVEAVRKVKDKHELPIMVMTSTYKHRDEIFMYKKLKVNYFLYSCTPLEDIFYIAKHLVFSKEMQSAEHTKPIIGCPVDFKVNGNWKHAEAVNLTPQ